MTTLVTGGVGFIGFHLCRRLLVEGHDIICVDNMYTGTQKHVDLLSRHKKFRFIRHDVTEPIKLDVDRIYNLACPASPPAYQADPVKTTLTNVLGVYNMLELARANGARILQASTSEIYGDPLVHPQTEDYKGNVDPIGPRACYDEGKRCAESLMDDYHRAHGVDIRIARIFNTYGPEMRVDDGRVVSNFIMMALKGEDLGVHGDGSHTRSLCYVDDLVDGLMRLMEHRAEFPQPVNLGNPHEMTVLELARKVLSMTGSQSRIAHLPEPVNDPQKRCPDISRAKRILGWEPKVDLDEGLQRTIAYFRAELDASTSGSS
jgi:UDP-glucuronate decarboxylase